MPGYRETELLIREIKNQPVIWDTSMEEYKDKGKRAIAWREICCSVEDNFTERSSHEQTRLVKELQARWKSIRDSYMKDCKRHTFRRRSSTGVLRPRRYVFADLLTFLKKDRLDISRETTTCIIRPATNITSVTLPDTGGENMQTEIIVKQEQQPEDECSMPTTATATTTATTTAVTTNFLDVPDLEPMELSSEPPLKRTRWVLDETERNYKEEKDNDSHHGDPEKDFFMGLLPMVKRLDEDQKLDFMAQVLVALRNVKASGRSVDGQVAPKTCTTGTSATRTSFPSHSNQIQGVASHRMATTAPPAVVSCPHHHQVFPAVYTSLPPYSFVHFGL